MPPPDIIMVSKLRRQWVRQKTKREQGIHTEFLVNLNTKISKLMLIKQVVKM